ncbi:MAG: hypothetical protein D6762_06265 [Candidatus Neomarinimicrobiota bacterium]|nr:MAG: hypothetical protein D6762_06265 [Candidatus Neomarinimicrobiota bacterium]
MRVLFECEHGYYWPQFAPVARELLRRPGYEVALSRPVDRSTEDLAPLRLDPLSAQLVHLKAAREPERLRRIRDWDPQWIFIGNKHTFTRLKRPHNRVIMIYHGIGLKQSYYRDLPRGIDAVAVESPHRMDLLRARGFRDEQLILTGFTKLDDLPPLTAEQRTDILERLGLNPDQPAVLYAPTFYPSSVETILPWLADQPPREQWIVALHAFSWTRNKYRRQRQWAERLRSSPGVRVLLPGEQSLLSILPGTDLLVTDISSVLFEYLALNRPIIHFLKLRLRWKHRWLPWILRRRLDLDRLEAVDFSVPVDQIGDLYSMVEDQLQHPDRLKSRRDRAIRRYLYRVDRQAAKRLIDSLESRYRNSRS